MAAQNKVNEKQLVPMNQKIYQASKRIYFELKYAKIFLYILNIMPLIASFFLTEEHYKIALAAGSFGLTLFNEFLKVTFSNFKEKAISLKALFEANISETVYAKIEYDRESTNEVYELSIRKSNNAIDGKKYKKSFFVPEDIPSKYTYLYLSRIQVAESRFILSKVKLIYGVALVAFTVVLIMIFFNKNLGDFIYQIVMVWNILIPLISVFTTCSKNMKHCVKLSADIDNFFADGDRSKERLSRFNHYIQGLVFEYRLALVIIPKFLYFVFRKHIKALRQGATLRFYDAIRELEIKEQKIIKQNEKKTEIHDMVVEIPINLVKPSILIKNKPIELSKPVVKSADLGHTTLNSSLKKEVLNKKITIAKPITVTKNTESIKPIKKETLQSKMTVSKKNIKNGL